jgi:glycosyltransferase involved in cell wall biosynthesis
MLSGYRHVFLRNFSPRPSAGFWSRVNPGVVTALIRGRYDAVLIMGWGSITSWLAFASCNALRTPFYINGDNSFVEDPRTLKGRLRRAALRALFARTSGFMLMGTMNGDFYRHFGADQQRFFFMPYAIDNQRFYNGSRMSAAERERSRADIGITDDRMVILFSGKLVARKRPLDLVKALEQMQHRDRVAIVFMGDGSERTTIEQYAKDRGITDVHVLGFVNQTQMPRMYGIADVFVLPSAYDPRGTVVNEAMACGLPVVITDRVGVWGEGDIVRNGENGFVFAVGDVQWLACILDRFAGDPALISRMGSRSLEIIGSWDFDRDVDGILSALRATVQHPSGHELIPARQAS